MGQEPPRVQPEAVHRILGVAAADGDPSLRRDLEGCQDPVPVAADHPPTVRREGADDGRRAVPWRPCCLHTRTGIQKEDQSRRITEGDELAPRRESARLEGLASERMRPWPGS